jgi:hypothetical protein
MKLLNLPLPSKPNFLIRSVILVLLFCQVATAQLRLEVVAETKAQTQVIDSIGYSGRHENVKQTEDAIAALTDAARKGGWLQAQLMENTRMTDSVFIAKINLGPRTENVHIYIGQNPSLRSLALAGEPDTVKVKISQVDAYLNGIIAKLEAKGYPLAKLRLTSLRPSGNQLHANLESDLGIQRQVNDIVINGYDKFPAGHKKQIARMFRNRTLNQEILQSLHDEIRKFRFVNQTRYPEILFTTDTTKVFVYLEKAKANRFDGIVGFSNDGDEGEETGKLRFNGYLDLQLVNALNSGEELSLDWKSDGNKQTTFNASAEIPYIFKSPLAIKASLHIFKQDSTFQNTRTAIHLGYFFRYNKRLYLGYEATESSDIQNTTSAVLSDFKNRFATLTYDYTDFSPGDFLFPDKTRMIAKVGAGSRDSKLQSNSQFLTELNVMHNFYLNEKNVIHLKSQNFLLQSEEYVISELYRFGGVNSIRGFYENSLQATQLTSLITEYRYVLVPGIYAHSIIDYGYFRDGSRNEGTGASGSLLGVGFGFGLMTKNGLFNLVYATGAPDDQALKLSNSIVHISFKARF